MQVVDMDRKRRVKQMQDASKTSKPSVEDAKTQSQNTRDGAQSAREKRRNLRLGVGLGAAGLASGFAASHFGRFGVWVEKVGDKGAGS